MGVNPVRVLTLLLAMLLAVTGGLTEVRAQTTATGAVDPVVADVVRMLDVGVEPDLVEAWVKSSGRQPRPLTADDMIALTQANAPKELVQTLLELSARPAPSPTAPAVQPPSPRTEPAPGAAPAPATPSTTGSAASQECCMLEVSVEYKADEGYEGDRTPLPQQDLYLYVDGEFLARVTSRGDIMPEGPTRVRTRLAQGTHTIRLTRELHVKTKDLLAEPAWDHITTVNPVILTLPMDQVASYNLDIRWIESQFTLKKPMSWRWSRNGQQLASEKHVGESKSKWPYLCDDVEASLAEGAIADWRARDRMKGCVTWASLWLDGVESSRQQVLEYLESHDFSPPTNYVGTGDWGN